jgi:hemoglobin
MVISLLMAGLVSNCFGIAVARHGSGSSDALPSLWALSVIVTPAITYHVARQRVLFAFRSRWAYAGLHHTKRVVLGSCFQDPFPEVMLEFVGNLCGVTEIQTVDVSATFLGSHSVRHICVAISSNSAHATFRTLDLTLCNITNGHGIDLLLLKSSTLRALILDENPMLMDHTSIFVALTSNTTLTSLSMSNAGMSAGSAIDLATALGTNITLASLNLAKNNIQYLGAHALADALQDNRSIRSLDVSWNKIGKVGLQLILDSLSGRRVKLNLTCNGVPTFEGEHLRNHLRQLLEPESPTISPNGSFGHATDRSFEAGTLEQLMERACVGSLYELLGHLVGTDPAAAVAAVCDEFYLRLISDRSILPFFRYVTMGRMRHLQRLCLTEFLGGPRVYKGLDMRSAHSHLRITSDIYDAVVGHLLATLVSLVPGVPPPVIRAVGGLTEALRPMIQNTEKLYTIPQDFYHNELMSEQAYRLMTQHQRAKPYFIPFLGSFWNTGIFKKRSAESPHPGIDMKDASHGGCCPWLRALQLETRKRATRVAPTALSTSKEDSRGRQAITATTPHLVLDRVHALSEEESIGEVAQKKTQS